MALDTAQALALVAQLQADAQKLHDIVNGDATTTVETDGGTVDSLAKRIAAIAASLQDEVDAGTASVSALVDTATSEAALAADWAEKAEDDPVTSGHYSALHWAAKSEEQAILAAPNRTAADLGAYGAMDLALSGWFYKTIDAGGEDFTFAGWPAADTVAFVLLELTDPGAGDLTWPAEVVWEGGAEPVWPAVGKAQVTFNSRDAGATIFASAVLYA